MSGSMMHGLGSIIGSIPCCFLCQNPFKEVQQGMDSLCRPHVLTADDFQGSVGLVSRFGQFYKSVDPGLVQVNVCTESLRVVDVKIQIIAIRRQTVMYVFLF